MAEVILESTDSKLLLLHSCHNLSQEEQSNGETYITLMTQNAKNLKEALQ